jgi:hypothetical protein
LRGCGREAEQETGTERAQELSNHGLQL